MNPRDDHSEAKSRTLDDEIKEEISSQRERLQAIRKGLRQKNSTLGGWTIWCRTLAKFRRRGEALGWEDLDWWYGEGLQATGDGSAGAELYELFDFDTGPPPIGRDERAQIKPKSYQDPEDRNPPGLALQQRVFLNSPKKCRLERQLDDFASGIAEDPVWDGVTCLAGVRGSGKSTILNRIEWFCRNWIRDLGRPLLIRFDIGMSFEPERFARDLADQLCRQARSYCAEPPFGSRFPGVTALTLAVGNAARWCHSNIIWATILLLLVLGLLGAAQVYRAGAWVDSAGQFSEEPERPVALSANGRYLATGSSDGTLEIWATQTGVRVRKYETGGIGVTGVALSSMGERVLATLENGIAKLWSVRNREAPAILTPDELTPVRLNPDQHDPDQLYPDQLHPKLRPDRRPDLSPVGQRLFLVSDPDTPPTSVQLVYMPAEDPLTPDRADGQVEGEIFSLDRQRRLRIAEKGNAVELRDATGQTISTFQGDFLPLKSAAFSPDGRRLVTVSKNGGANLWDAEAGKHLGTLNSWKVLHAAFAPDGQHLVTTFTDGTAGQWDIGRAGTSEARLDSPDPVLEIGAGRVTHAAVAADGGTVVTTSSAGTVDLWDAKTGESVTQLKDPEGKTGRVTRAEVTGNGSRVITTSSAGSADLWDAKSGEWVAQLKDPEGTTGQVTHTSVSADGRRIVTTSQAGTAHLWTVENNDQIAHLNTLRHRDGGKIHRALFVHGGYGKIVTAAQDGTARLWDGEDGDPLRIAGASRNTRQIELPLLGKQPSLEIYAVVLILSSIVLLGLAHGARGHVAAIGRVLGIARNRVPILRQWTVAALISVPFAVALSALLAWVIFSEQELVLPKILGSTLLDTPAIREFFGKFFEVEDWHLAFLSPFVLSISATCIAILVLPGWWEDYIKFQRTTRQIQSQDEPRLIPLPYVGSLLAQVLPRSDDHEELDKISMPFLQQRTKTILELCVDAFGHVVILVDDADVLPTEKFHLLMRVLRPVSKVPGARCVIAVPNFFFEVLKSPRLGDAHSTVRECLFLGDPEIFVQGFDAPFNVKLQKRSDLQLILLDLLRSRLKVPLKEEVETSHLVNSELFSKALENWNFGENPGAEDLKDDEKFFIRETEGSKREILRAIEIRLPVFPRNFSGEEQFILGGEEYEQERAKRLEEYRQNIEDLEHVFHCDARSRAEVNQAKEALAARNGRRGGSTPA